MPQALSIVSILVILMMFAFSMQLMSIAPSYVTFGDQKHSLGDGKYEQCTLKESKISHVDLGKMVVGYGCQMTMIAQLYTKIQLTVPLFSLIYYVLSWAFISCFIFFLVYHAYYKKSYHSHSLQGYSTLGQDDDDE
jgi:LMBR1 domain-containing protein 1